MLMITIEQLEILAAHSEALVLNDMPEPNVGAIAAPLASAMNDWPTPVSDLEMYSEEVRTVIGREVRETTVTAFLESLNHVEQAWRAESLHQLATALRMAGYERSLKEVMKALRLVINS